MVRRKLRNVMKFYEHKPWQSGCLTHIWLCGSRCTQNVLSICTTHPFIPSSYTTFNIPDLYSGSYNLPLKLKGNDFHDYIWESSCPRSGFSMLFSSLPFSSAWSCSLMCSSSSFLRSSLERWCTIPAPNASPSTFTEVRNRSLQYKKKTQINLFVCYSLL